jgi:co-chaperonin GroES (HSP10)
VITHAELNEAVKELEAYSDRVVVIVDEYKSGRECTKCEGKGHLEVICPHCHGKMTFKGRKDEDYCPDCSIGTGPLRKSLGHVPCDLCAGQGTSSIVVPEDAEKRPTTGIITSVGALCDYFRVGGEWVLKPPAARLAVGDHVFFTLYSGNEYKLGSKSEVVVRILKEAEILGKLKLTNKKQLKLEPERFSELAEVGMQDSN